MARYRLSPEANSDLERIWLYGLETWGVNAADRYIEDLYHRFEKIAEQPTLYQRVDEIREGYRRSVFKSDSIFFRIGDDAVDIMAVIGQQDLKDWV